jgi:glycosyltransferase involved in cell wall biosynthesis
MSYLMEIIFWSCLVVIFYVYIGYPLCAFLLTHIIRKPLDQCHNSPMISVLIAAFNEEIYIRQTIENKLLLNYPADKFEIIIISDGSTDQTDSIVQSIEDKRVKLMRQYPRAGKTSALNMAVQQAKGEILVFSDANSIYKLDVLKHLSACFADERVGYVTGKMIYIDPDGTTIGDGCSAYMRYENKLREWETAIGSVVGVDGGVDAMRKELYSALNIDQLPDFVQPLKVVEKGYRVVYQPEALLKESALNETTDEYKMRVRVSLRSLWALKDMQSLLWGSAGFLFAWQIWSHKVLRYFCFCFLFFSFWANLSLVASPLYLFIFILQLAVYAGAIISYALEQKQIKIPLLYFPHYFVILNVASAHAFIKFFMGKKQITWSPRKG